MTVSAIIGKYAVEAESMNDVAMLRKLADALEKEMQRKSEAAKEARGKIEDAIADYIYEYGKLNIIAVDETTGKVVSDFKMDDGLTAYVH